MKIQVLQGINHINPITTIILDMDSAPKTDLLDQVGSLHPVFMEEYKVECNRVSIQSRLPHLWKEAAVALNNYSTNEWSYDLAKEYIYGTVIKQQILSMSTIPILRAAHEMGYETTQYFIEEGFTPASTYTKFNRYYNIGVGRESAVTTSIASSQDSYLAKMIQEDKWLTNTMISRMKLPIAKWQIVENEEDLEEILPGYTLPVVIKPSSLTGGHGVTTKINDLESAKKAFRTAMEAFANVNRSEKMKKVLIQETVTGEDYRLIVINGRMEIATQRIPAFVTGDGISSISNLIEVMNKDPRRDMASPVHILKPIVIDEQLLNYLSEQKIDLKFVPSKGEKVFVRKVASMSQGGITEDYTDKVHPQIRFVVETLAESLHAFVLGVDIICKDISSPLTPENGSIIECNTMPESYLNAFPVIGKQYPHIGKMVVNGLMQQKHPTTKIVALGCPKEDLEKHIRISGVLQEGKTGMYSQGAVYINSEKISSGNECWRAVEGLKINKSLSNIILHYAEVSEAMDNGLGFDRIDCLIAGKDIDKELLSTLQGYANLGMIGKLETI